MKTPTVQAICPSTITDKYEKRRAEIFEKLHELGVKQLMQIHDEVSLDISQVKKENLPKVKELLSDLAGNDLEEQLLHYELFGGE